VDRTARIDLRLCHWLLEARGAARALRKPDELLSELGSERLDPRREPRTESAKPCSESDARRAQVCVCERSKRAQARASKTSKRPEPRASKTSKRPKPRASKISIARQTSAQIGACSLQASKQWLGARADRHGQRDQAREQDQLLPRTTCEPLKLIRQGSRRSGSARARQRLRECRRNGRQTDEDRAGRARLQDAHATR
jgi:hypothetical protein